MSDLRPIGLDAFLTSRIGSVVWVSAQRPNWFTMMGQLSQVGRWLGHRRLIAWWRERHGRLGPTKILTHVQEKIRKGFLFFKSFQNSQTVWIQMMFETLNDSYSHNKIQEHTSTHKKIDTTTWMQQKKLFI
jgi:hypothetical protein